MASSSSSSDTFTSVAQAAHIQRGWEVTEDTSVEEIKDRLESLFGWQPDKTVLTTRPHKQVLEDGHVLRDYSDIVNRRQFCDSKLAGGDCVIDCHQKA